MLVDFIIASIVSFNMTIAAILQLEIREIFLSCMAMLPEHIKLNIIILPTTPT